MNNTPLDRLKYHVSGAIERGEGTPIVSIPVRKLVWHLFDGNENCGVAYSHLEAIQYAERTGRDFKPRYVTRIELENIVEDEIWDDTWNALKGEF